LTGEVRCAGDSVELPLASQSGMERLNVRIASSGKLQATMHVRATDPLLVAGLSANGFRSINGEQVLRIDSAL
jgi:general secretion pathway protein N